MTLTRQASRPSESTALSKIQALILPPRGAGISHRPRAAASLPRWISLTSRNPSTKLVRIKQRRLLVRPLRLLPRRRETSVLYVDLELDFFGFVYLMVTAGACSAVIC
ncbi:hypothetical protein K438DRAFT_2012430, partial [Mycena galopus ATCC 62051]